MDLDIDTLYKEFVGKRNLEYKIKSEQKIT